MMIMRGAVALLLCMCLCWCSKGEDSRSAIAMESSTEDDCLYESRDVCTRADVLGCVWCDLPERCYPASRSLELGVLCSWSSKLQNSVDMIDCTRVTLKDSCVSNESCRWCKSEAIDDSCFGVKEAIKLPVQIFDCISKLSSS